MEEIPNKVRDILGIVVPVNLHNDDGKDWLEIVVEPYPSPISYKGEYHYRSGSTKQELKGAALNKLFKTKAAKSGRMSEDVLDDDNDSLLENLELKEGNYLKQATTLLFYDKPEKFVSGAYIKIGFFVR